jgi:hypothetical protein
VGNGILANCPANTLCLYEHKDFIGTVLEISPGTSYPSLHVLSCPGSSSSRHRSSNGTWGDMMSSWTNNTSLAYCWHEDINYGGGPVSMHGGGAALSYVGSDSNDKASSIQPC